MFERITPSFETERISTTTNEDNEMIHEGSQVQFVFVLKTWNMMHEPHASVETKPVHTRSATSTMDKFSFVS